MSTSSSRIVFIDVARALAIALALFAHAMIDLSAWSLESWASMPIRVWTRSAAPLFIVMFGMMIELVYVRRAREQGLRSVAGRLLWRSLQCYGAYVCTAVAGWLGGILTLKGGVTASLMITDAYFGNILKWYTFGLVLAIPLLYARLRWGIGSVAAMAAAAWAVAAPLSGAATVLPAHATNVAGVLVGMGRFGPSLFHGMTFVAIGMGLSYALRRGASRTAFTTLCGGLLLAGAGTFVVLALGPESVGTVLREAIGDGWRRQNHPGYFALGGGLAVATLLGLAAVIPDGRPLPRGARLPMRFGTSSLLAFTVGNVLLNLRPRHIEAGGFYEALALAVGFLAVTLLVLHVPDLVRAVVPTPEPALRRLRAVLRRGTR
jgi:hypothetical protein